VFNNGATGQRKGAQEYYIAYAQDEWRIASNVTLNYGVRYEYYSPVREVNDLNVQFDINTGTILPPNHPFYKGIKNELWPPFRLELLASIEDGDSWRLSVFSTAQDRRKIFFQPIESDLINTVVSGGAYPIDVNAVRQNFISNPTNRSFGPRAYSQDYEVPETDLISTNLSLQQELPGKLVATAAYVGSQGRKPLPAEHCQPDRRRPYKSRSDAGWCHHPRI